MVITDPIADFLVRIKNAQKAGFEYVDIPASKMKLSIARVLKDEGYISGYKFIKDKKQGVLRIVLKYDQNKTPVITGMKRISKPSRRVYVKCDKIPYILNGYGIAILSTSKGIMQDREARKRRLGGELLCSVW
ncbi:MAG TPA: 30S ribosomal protein S8 [Deltaproteobacteria bacterium]|nr:MAG: 30S ribosomal protein S8 [Deltaproteobacteria bacterium]RLB05307.1 MAG: 30S ribosomal protein S8 [Deltaproteobacteria bacterium]HDM76264.1 30S ribosomal protein S8 [Deltaproteobacteria bacterium]